MFSLVFFRWGGSCIIHWLTLSIQVCPKKGISPTILFWGIHHRSLKLQNGIHPLQSHWNELQNGIHHRSFLLFFATDTEQMYWISEGLLEDIQRTSLTFHYKHSVRFRDDDHEIRYRQKSESPLGSGPKWLEDEVPPGMTKRLHTLEIVKAWLLRWSKHQGIQRTTHRFC